MNKLLIFSNRPSCFLNSGARILLLLVAAGTLALHAQERDRDRERDKKHETRREAPAAPPKAESKPEPRRESPPPRHEPRPESRRETLSPRQEPRQEFKREQPPSREEHRRETPAPRPESRQEPRRETPAPREEHRRETPSPRSDPRSDPRRDPGPDARRDGTTIRTVPGPEGRRDPASRTDPNPSRFPSAGAQTRPDSRRDPGSTSDFRRDPDARPRTSDPVKGRPDQLRDSGRTASDPRRHSDRPNERRGPERQVVHTRNGGEIHRTPTGAIREVRTNNGAVIRHSPSGVRHVEVVRPGGKLVVANATGRRGYIQKPVLTHGHRWVQRTYIQNGVTHAHFFRPWSHAGREYHIFTPHRHYRPSFYSWVYSPWARPVSYRWGWDARPWYRHYGGYFSPYPSYRSPAFWLADFLIATTLEVAYLAQNASIDAPPVIYNSSTALSPEVKDAIADEVRRQMDDVRERADEDRDSERLSSPPPIFSERGPRIFLVSDSVMAYSGDQEFPLVEGDVLQLAATPSQDSEWAEVKVLASRASSRSKGSMVSVRTVDLQEMYNQMQGTLEQGMSKLQSDQGKDGIPNLPPQSMGTVNASYANDLQPDAQAVEELTAAVKEANRSEQDMINQGQEPSASGGTISLGMTVSEVENAMGRPKNTVDLGSKKIYLYNNLKITFLNGRVSDVQ